MSDPTWIEVYDVCDGALGETFEFVAIVDAEDKARELRDSLTEIEYELGSWEVYVLPHYCVRGDASHDRQRIERGEGACICATWLTDHRPVYSSAVSA